MVGELPKSHSVPGAVISLARFEYDRVRLCPKWYEPADVARGKRPIPLRTRLDQESIANSLTSRMPAAPFLASQVELLHVRMLRRFPEMRLGCAHIGGRPPPFLKFGIAHARKALANAIQGFLRERVGSIRALPHRLAHTIWAQSYPAIFKTR